MPGILSTNNPVVKVSGLRPSTTGLLVLLYYCRSILYIRGGGGVLWKTSGDLNCHAGNNFDHLIFMPHTHF